jgi:hypothetical protein
MKKQFYLLILILLCSSNILLSSQIGFIENKGQIICNQNDNVLFYYNQGLTSYYICPDKLIIVQNALTSSFTLNHNSELTTSSYRTDIEFVDAIENIRIQKSEKFDSYINFYKNGNSSGNCEINHFKSISLENIYPNIDLKFHLTNDGIKYDFICKPLSDPSLIKLRTVGFTNLLINAKNEFIIETPLKMIQNRNPLTYDEHKQIIDSKYKLSGGILSFDIGKYDKNSTLIIDPEINISENIEWSTYFGGSGIDWVRSIRIDKKNDVVVGGCSYSTNLPTTAGVFQRNNKGNSDFFITKFTDKGAMIWTTYVGGSNMDLLFFLDICSTNEIVAGGDIRSGNFPVTTNAFQTNYAGGTADCGFVKLTEDGKMIYATFVGGEEFEGFDDGVVDKNDDVWMIGRTTSSKFPVTTNAYNKFQSGTYDAVIVKFSKSNKILYSSHWGAKNNEYAEGVVVDSENNIFISGYTDSDDYPVIGNAYQKKYNGTMDAFLVKMDSIGIPIWSTYFGGKKDDYGSNVTVDTKDNVIMSGITGSIDLPITPLGFQKSSGGGADGFIVKFDKYGNIIWNTYLGGSKEEGLLNTLYDQGGAIRTDDKDNVVYCFRTQSNNIVTTPNAFQKAFKGINDAMVVILDSDCNLLWSTYIGGKDDDIAEDVCVDNSGCLYVAGITKSSDFPVLNAFQPKLAGDWDGFIMKFGVTEPCLNKPFSYTNFLNSKLIKYTGIARKADSTIKLTDNRQNISGAAWFDGLIPIDKGFTTKFAFRFSDGQNYNCQDGSLPGADGIAFLIQNAGVSSIGFPGGGLGYENIPNSLAIEYDTFSNDSTQIENYFDPNGNHVAVQSLGSAANSPKHTKSANIAMNSAIFPIRSDKTIYYSQIDYSTANKTLTVYLDTNKTLTNRVIYIENFDISKYVSLIGGTKAVLGFTSATGCATQTHEILSWEICLESTEPATDVEDDNISLATSTLYPNPAENYFSISNEQLPFVKSIRIYDCMSSHVIKSFNLESVLNNKFDIRNLSNGFYLVAIDTGDKIILDKLIILK